MHATTPLKVDGKWVCRACRVPVPSEWAGRRTRPPVRCRTCRIEHSARMWAIQKVAALEVARALRRGELMPPGAFYCTDCDAPALAYDHRDYTQPLNVDPVCRKCNARRGHALVWGNGYHPAPETQGATP